MRDSLETRFQQIETQNRRLILCLAGVTVVLFASILYAAVYWRSAGQGASLSLDKLVVNEIVAKEIALVKPQVKGGYKKLLLVPGSIGLTEEGGDEMREFMIISLGEILMGSSMELRSGGPGSKQITKRMRSTRLGAGTLSMSDSEDGLRKMRNALSLSPERLSLAASDANGGSAPTRIEFDVRRARNLVRDSTLTVGVLGKLVLKSPKGRTLAELDAAADK